jgi:hypothetical protein
MARWTQTLADHKHLSDISTHSPFCGIVSITLQNGKVIEGVMRRLNMGNNAGEGGWQYYGECEIETKDRQRFVIDYLDIKTVKNAWSDATSAEYERLGLISIAR